MTITGIQLVGVRTMSESTEQQSLRDQALMRLKKKRDFVGHLLLYLAVNALCLGIWLSNGANLSDFWPIFPLAFWGILLGLHARDVFLSPPSEAAIQKEVDRLTRG
jgi:hypothetical protein